MGRPGLRAGSPLPGRPAHGTSHPAPFSPRFPFLFQEGAGAETSSFYSALLRIQPKVMHCWRPMRRAFKACDEGGTGLVGVTDFRKVSLPGPPPGPRTHGSPRLPPGSPQAHTGASASGPSGTGPLLTAPRTAPEGPGAAPAVAPQRPVLALPQAHAHPPRGG